MHNKGKKKILAKKNQVKKEVKIDFSYYKGKIKEKFEIANKSWKFNKIKASFFNKNKGIKRNIYKK